MAKLAASVTSLGRDGGNLRVGFFLLGDGGENAHADVLVPFGSTAESVVDAIADRAAAIMVSEYRRSGTVRGDVLVLGISKPGLLAV